MEPVVSIAEGRVRGLEHPHGFAFLGIPFAEPPFGSHRFGAPMRTGHWDGVRDATAYAPTAPQPAQGFTLIPEPIIEGGDAPSCLSLNVFTPTLGDARLPVLVWIHGGGYTTGTPSSAWYDGRSFARDGVVVVSMGYRLGFEGFGLIDGAPANRAVLDWLAGLEWVHDNIAEFGGDPTRVTVGGQSAGGGACCVLATLPRARGLFHRVVAMSGSVQACASRAEAARVAAAVAAEAGVAAQAEALAARSPSQLVEAQTRASHLDGVGGEGGRTWPLMFRPVLDGDLVTTSLLDAFAGGATDALDLLVGCTRDEMVAAVGGTDVDDARLARRLGRLGLDPDGVAAYQSLDASDNGERYGRAATDAWFRIPALRAAEARFDASAPTFVYDFAWPSPALGGIGAVHCIDLPFAWDLLEADGVEEVAGTGPPQMLADRMHRAWVSFVADGDPGWPAYRLSAPGDGEIGPRATMCFDQTSDVVADLLGAERGRWP
jgi:para-nitrobenzyl esterase